MRKKLLIALLALGALLAFTACDSSVSSTGTSGSGSSSSSASAAAKTEYQLGEGIKVDDAIMTVVSGKQFTPTNQFDKPATGKVYYIVNIKIENGGKSALSYNEFNYKIEDANGVQKDAAFIGSEVPNKMSSGSLAAGGKLDANIVFEVPQDMKGLKLIMEPNFFSKQQIKIIMTP